MLEEIPPGSAIEFEYILPVDEDTCRQHVSANCARHLPDAIQRKKLTIVANGPSAKGLDFSRIEGPILTVNGSINLFTGKGTWPAYWAVCDSQELVADFLPQRPPQETVYFVAAKCHPAVFQKLHNNNVQLWHISDHTAKGKARIPQAVSVTISATWLMHRLGFTDFEYYGWDGCLMDNKHHASSETEWTWENNDLLHLNYGGKVTDNEVIGGRTFTTTRSWAAEARSAEQFFQLAEYFDLGVKIHGDGMFACTQQSLKDT